MKPRNSKRRIIILLLLIFICFGIFTNSSDSNSLAQVKIISSTATADSVTITWKEVANADGYCVYQFINQEWEGIDLVESSLLTYTLTDLTSDTIYCLKIEAYYLDESFEFVCGEASKTCTVSTLE